MNPLSPCSLPEGLDAFSPGLIERHFREAGGDGIPGSINGFVYSAAVPASRPEWHFTPRISAHHPEASLPMESALVVWQR